DTAAMGGRAMLEQVDALPGSERHPAAAHRYGKLGQGESRPDVSGHIVGAFDGVAVKGIILRHPPAEEGVEGMHDVRVGIFLDGQRRGSVLHEHGQQAGRDAEAAQPLVDLAGEFVKTLAARGYMELVSVLLHYSTVTLLARLRG